ncbi:MAG: LD-carboxypeptidase [Oscillospiraceae bacterium]|jgi:muramoyltetrapeptide carboxypeptidase|nr:LD-carboxypeptidase [Oscillospiraceae bacterium]
MPEFLRSGDRVALLAPSGPQPPEKLDAAVQSVVDFGLVPEVYDSCRARHGYLAGSDSLRAADINRAFADASVRGVICIRGGYGAHRLMNLIDFDIIRANPKPLFGYSDITALHIAINQLAGVATYHAPMPGTEWYKGLDAFTEAQTRAVLFGPLPREAAPATVLSAGSARGVLTGGNLSLIVSTLGTPYEIDTRGKILFIEDVDEEPYAIDRMLLHLRDSGKLADCAGIVLGAFTNCVAGKKEPVSLTLGEIFAELLPADKPVLSDFQCGHILPTLCLPMGAEVAIENGNFKII